MIDRYTEQRIKDTTAIAEVFKYYNFALRKQGSGYVTQCPFHNDRNPSMHINPARNICKCFSCGTKAMDAVQFVMDYEHLEYPEALRRLADICGIVVAETSGEALPPPARMETPTPTTEQMPTFTDAAIVSATLSHYDNNPLFAFISSLFGNEQTRQAFTRYNVGTANFVLNSNQGNRCSVVFWQIDEGGNVRGGKIVAYDEQTGKRIKGNPDNARDRDVNWSHIATKRYDYNLRQCIFGQHLLSAEIARVNIVESEKTAILASLYFGDTLGVWVATGGKDVTTSARRITEAASLLSGKSVILYPDADGYDDWKRLSARLNDIGIDANVSTLMKDVATNTKYDIGDYIVMSLTIEKDRETPTPTTEQAEIFNYPTAAYRTPIATGETEEQAMNSNAAMMGQALFAIDLLKGIYDFKAPTPEQIEILDPNAKPPSEAPF